MKTNETKNHGRWIKALLAGFKTRAWEGKGTRRNRLKAEIRKARKRRDTLALTA